MTDATPMGDKKALCLNCANASIVRGKNNEFMVYCGSFQSQIKFEVVECTSYSDPNRVSLNTYAQMAWYSVESAEGGVTFRPLEGSLEHKEWQKLTRAAQNSGLGELH